MQGILAYFSDFLIIAIIHICIMAYAVRKIFYEKYRSLDADYWFLHSFMPEADEELDTSVDYPPAKKHLYECRSFLMKGRYITDVGHWEERYLESYQEVYSQATRLINILILTGVLGTLIGLYNGVGQASDKSLVSILNYAFSAFFVSIVAIIFSLLIAAATIYFQSRHNKVIQQFKQKLHLLYHLYGSTPMEVLVRKMGEQYETFASEMSKPLNQLTDSVQIFQQTWSELQGLASTLNGLYERHEVVVESLERLSNEIHLIPNTFQQQLDSISSGFANELYAVRGRIEEHLTQQGNDALTEVQNMAHVIANGIRNSFGEIYDSNRQIVSKLSAITQNVNISYQHFQDGVNNIVTTFSDGVLELNQTVENRLTGAGVSSIKKMEAMAHQLTDSIQIGFNDLNGTIIENTDRQINETTDRLLARQENLLTTAMSRLTVKEMDFAETASTLFQRVHEASTSAEVLSNNLHNAATLFQQNNVTVHFQNFQNYLEHSQQNLNSMLSLMQEQRLYLQEHHKKVEQESASDKFATSPFLQSTKMSIYRFLQAVSVPHPELVAELTLVFLLFFGCLCTFKIVF